jgi:hypothetical protein
LTYSEIKLSKTFHLQNLLQTATQYQKREDKPSLAVPECVVNRTPWVLIYSASGVRLISTWFTTTVEPDTPDALSSTFDAGSADLMMPDSGSVGGLVSATECCNQSSIISHLPLSARFKVTSATGEKEVQSLKSNTVKPGATQIPHL